MESFDRVGVGCLYVSCSYASSFTASYAATLDAHGLLCLVWGGWVLVCYIEGVDELYRLAASPLGYVMDLLPWALYLLPKLRLSCTLVLGQGQDVDGGFNASCWLVRRVVCALMRIVCYLRRRLVVSYFQLVEAVLQHLHLSLCCCCALCVANNLFCNGRFVHCGFCSIECRTISFLD